MDLLEENASLREQIAVCLREYVTLGGSLSIETRTKMETASREDRGLVYSERLAGADRALAFLVTKDKGGISPLNRLKAHLAGNRSGEKALIDRAIVTALIAVVESRIRA